MGGPGSGQYYRWQRKQTTLDEVQRLDVRWLYRQGYLQPWARAFVTWHQGNRETGSVRVAMGDGSLVVEYRGRPRGTAAWEDVRQVITLDWTPCHYGGQRPWFLCPGCHRRVAVLCAAGKWFLCRHCSRLPYTSQYELPLDRLSRKTRKLRERLGPYYTKPKGMHWRTCARLRKQAMAAELAWEIAYATALERLRR